MRAPRESDLVKGCLQLLTARRWFCWRINTGALRSGRRLVRFGNVGQADVGAVKDGRYLEVECKLPGNKPTPAQEAWGAALRRAGGWYVVACSLAELETDLNYIERTLRGEG